MTHQSPPHKAMDGTDAGRQIAQLRHVLGLVEQIGGAPQSFSREQALDEAARVSGAYGEALPVVQRRFDAMAAEAAAWAAAGVEALVAAGGRGGTGAAARRLGQALRATIGDLTALLRL